MTRLNKEQNQEIEKYILEGINSEDVELSTPKEKLKYALERFREEYSFNIKRLGEYKAFAEWLQGLALDYYFYNSDILALAKGLGQPVETEKEQDKILNTYWHFLTVRFYRLVRKYKIEVQ